MKLLLSFLACLSGITLSAQVTRQWAATYNGAGDFNDRFTCAARDAQGNILLGGSTTNPDADRDYLVQKLDANGNLLWTWQYNGAGSVTDEVRAITTDPAGNVYVTGLSQGDNTSEDYLTVKLSPAGDSLWTRRYDFVGEYDQANALFVDAGGNVLVTGQSDGDPSATINNDYATLKYAPNGSLLWVKRYNGLGDGTDEAVAIIADPNGKIYLSGRTSNGDNDDYGTLCYAPDGGLLWFRFDDRGGRDRATALTLDVNNNLIVTGRSSNGDNDDYWTLKCDGTGNLLWDAAYDFLDQDRPLAITTDPAGTIIVTGQSDKNVVAPTDWDFLTVAYQPNGTQLWAKRYDGGLSTDDIALAVGANGGGDVFVTGISDVNPGTAVSNEIVTIRYQTGSGQQQWVKTIPTAGNQDQISNAVVALSDGCLVAGYQEDANGRRNAAAFRYNTAGTQTWKHSFDGIGDNNDNVRAIAVGATGNVFAAGYSVGGGNNRDMAVVQFTANGTLSCGYTLEGTAPGGEDDTHGIVLDAAGNAIAAGVLKNSGSSNDIALLNISGLCDTLWTKLINGPGNGSDRVYDMVRDAAGNLYLAGRVDTDPAATANDDAFTAKLAPNGTVLWSKTYNSAGTNADRGVFVRLSAAGDVYVAGRTWTGTQYDIFLLKYSNAGQQLWVKSWNGGGNDEPTGLALDASGNAAVCGTAWQGAADTLRDFITLKISPSGSLLWEKRYQGAGLGDDLAEAVAVDSLGKILVAGRSDVATGAPLDDDVVLLAYAPDGSLNWSRTFSHPGNDAPDDLAVGAGNQIYLTGHFAANTTLPVAYDVATYILAPGGATLWSDVFDSPLGGSDVPNLIYLNGQDFYVAGSSSQGAEQRNILLIKYSGTVVGTEAPVAETPVRVGPNPFNGALRVQVADTAPEGTLFVLSDALGRVVWQEKLTGRSADIALTDLPPGLYAYRLLSGKQLLATGKLTHF